MPSSSVKKFKKGNKAARVLLALRIVIVKCLRIVCVGKYLVLGEFTSTFAIEVQFTTTFAIEVQFTTTFAIEVQFTTTFAIEVQFTTKFAIEVQFTTTFSIEVQFTTAFPYPTNPPPTLPKKTGKETGSTTSWFCIHLLCVSVPLYIVK